MNAEEESHAVERQHAARLRSRNQRDREHALRLLARSVDPALQVEPGVGVQHRLAIGGHPAADAFAERIFSRSAPAFHTRSGSRAQRVRPVHAQERGVRDANARTAPTASAAIAASVPPPDSSAPDREGRSHAAVGFLICLATAIRIRERMDGPADGSEPVFARRCILGALLNGELVREAKEGVDDLRIASSSLGVPEQDLERSRRGQSWPVRPIRGQRVEAVHDRQNPRADWNRSPRSRSGYPLPSQFS